MILSYLNQSYFEIVTLILRDLRAQNFTFIPNDFEKQTILSCKLNFDIILQQKAAIKQRKYKMN